MRCACNTSSRSVTDRDIGVPSADARPSGIASGPQRALSCQWCGHHLHPTARTPFADSRTPLQLWFYAIYLFATSRYGVPATELREELGVTYKTAWRMARRIRRFMAGVDGALP